MTTLDVTRAMSRNSRALYDEVMKIRDDEIAMMQRAVSRTQAGDKNGWKELSFDNTSVIINRLIDAVFKHCDDIEALANKVYEEED